MGNHYGVVPGMPRIWPKNWEEMMQQGWMFVKNIPRWDENPFYEYSEDFILNHPCLGVIEQFKSEFGETNVTTGAPIDEAGNFISAVKTLGLYVRANVNYINNIVEEWEQIPSIKRKIMDIHLDRWLEEHEFMSSG